MPLKENAQGQQRRGFPPYSPTPRLKMYPLHPGLGSEEEEEERGGEVTMRAEMLTGLRELLCTQFQRHGLAMGCREFGVAGEQGHSATFLLGRSPRCVMSEQEISQDVPERAWLRTLCAILAQILQNGS